MNYKADSLYPEIKVKEEDFENAKILLNIYAGRNGILNNIFTYLYQSSFLNENYTQILYNLIDVELFHAKIISKLINLLGFKPKFIYESMSNFKYFNTSYINYEVDERKILENNLTLKEDLVKLYNDSIDKIEDEKIKENLKRIVMDEKIHIKIFKDLCQ